MRLVAELGVAEVTAGDVAPDGSAIALRSYHDVWLWGRARGSDLAEALAGAPCEGPVPDEVQGEALTFLAEGGYLTASEGRLPDLHLVPLR